MERRDFLRATGLGFGALSLPGWMHACSSRKANELGSDETVSFDGPPRDSKEALLRARKQGRPLLVLVIPNEGVEESANLFGIYINRASDEMLADLSLCDLWCASAAEIQSELAPGLAIGAQTLAVLVETDGYAARTIDGPAPAEPKPMSAGLHENDARVEAAKRRNEFLFEKLRAVIAPDVATLQRRAEANRRSLRHEEWLLLGGALDERTQPSELLADHAPAWVRLRAERADAIGRLACIGLLARQADARLRAKSPPRTRWARSSGCGMTIEEKPHQPGPPCGMACVPEFSSRFLTFWTEEDGG